MQNNHEGDSERHGSDTNFMTAIPISLKRYQHYGGDTIFYDSDTNFMEALHEGDTNFMKAPRRHQTPGSFLLGTSLVSPRRLSSIAFRKCFHNVGIASMI